MSRLRHRTKAPPASPDAGEDSDVPTNLAFSATGRTPAIEARAARFATGRQFESRHRPRRTFPFLSGARRVEPVPVNVIALGAGPAAVFGRWPGRGVYLHGEMVALEGNGEMLKLKGYARCGPPCHAIASAAPKPKARMPTFGIVGDPARGAHLCYFGISEQGRSRLARIHPMPGSDGQLPEGIVGRCRAGDDAAPFMQVDEMGEDVA